MWCIEREVFIVYLSWVWWSIPSFVSNLEPKKNRFACLLLLRLKTYWSCTFGLPKSLLPASPAGLFFWLMSYGKGRAFQMFKKRGKTDFGICSPVADFVLIFFVKTVFIAISDLIWILFQSQDSCLKYCFTNKKNNFVHFERKSKFIFKIIDSEYVKRNQ